MKRVARLSLIIFCIALLLGCSGQTSTETEKPLLSVDPIFTSMPSASSNPSKTADNPDDSSSKTETPVSASPKPYNEEDIVFEITSLSPFFYEDVVNGYFYSSDAAKWKEEIESRFGIELEVTSLYELNRETLIYYSSRYVSDVYENIKNNISNNTIRGLFQIGNPSFLTKLIQDKLILPLDQFLESNTNWHSMPKDYKEAFKIDGTTYAIPSLYSDKAFSRYIRKDWLSKFNLELPTTIDDFYYVAKKFTYDDPDGDDEKNTNGFTHYGPTGIEDIFASFDVRTDPSGNTFITMNPNTELWEDSMLKPEMNECLEFLRSCRIEGILSRNTSIEGKNQFLRGASGSYCTSLSFYAGVADLIKANSHVQSEPVIDFIPAMIHTINTNIAGHYTVYNSSYVLVKNSNYPNSTINTFIDVFIADKAGFILGSFGPEGEAFSMVDDLIIRKTYEFEEKSYTYQGPKIVQKSPMVTGLSKISDLTYDPDSYDGSKNDNAAHSIRMEALKANSLSYKIPWNVVFPDYSDTVLSHMDELRAWTIIVINEVLGGMTSFEEVLIEYRDAVKISGMQEFINEQNEKLGVSSGQAY